MLTLLGAARGGMSRVEQKYNTLSKEWPEFSGDEVQVGGV